VKIGCGTVSATKLNEQFTIGFTDPVLQLAMSGREAAARPTVRPADQPSASAVPG